MGNIFDDMQDGLFDLTTEIFGYDASWTPSTPGSVEQVARVNYRKPNEKDSITNGIVFMPLVYFIEYKEGVFPELKTLVDNGSDEIIIIKGAQHIVRSVQRMYDGKTFHAHAERIN
jgi:hypothetical protein